MKNIITDIFSILNQTEKRRFCGLTAFNILISLLDVFSLALMLFVINFYTRQTPLFTVSFLPLWLMNVHSVALILAFLVFFLIKNIAAQLAFKLQYQFVYQVAGNVSQANMFNYLRGNYAYHVQTDSAISIRKISRQPIEFAHYILAGVQQIITEIMLIVFVTVTILMYNAKLFVIVAVLLLPVALLLWLYTRKKINDTRGNIKVRSANALQYLKEALGGYIESNLYGKNIFFTTRYAKSQQALNTSLAGLQIIQGVPTRMLELFAVFGLFILIIAGNFTGQNIGGFILLGAFIAAAYRIIPGLVKIINLSGQVKAYRFTVNDLKEEKRTSAFSPDEQHCPPLQSISFDNITFSYKGHPVLNNFKMQLETGDFIGLAGPSGKGKTTIINILLGLVQEDSGRVCINNQPFNPEGRQLYWPKIAYVKQQSFLIHDTIEKNIVLDDNVYSAEKLKCAVRMAGLEDFIGQFAEGIKKVITEDGKNISGGQRQRIAIARALFKDAALIILDEPFNELDNASETLLLGHFKQLAAMGKMIILVTHQQKSLAFCNKIISLNG